MSHRQFVHTRYEVMVLEAGRWVSVGTYECWDLDEASHQADQGLLLYPDSRVDKVIFQGVFELVRRTVYPPRPDLVA